MGFGIFIFYAAASLGVIPFAVLAGVFLSALGGVGNSLKACARNKARFKERYGKDWRAHYDECLRSIAENSAPIDRIC